MKGTLHRQKGLAMTEMVIVTPLMLLLFLAVCELGQALFQYNTLTKNVRDGVRYVAGTALLGTTGTVFITPDVADDARNLVVYGNTAGTGQPRLPALTTGQVSVGDAGGGLVLVRADYPYQPLTGSLLQTFGLGSGSTSLNVTLTAAVTMRAL